MSKKRAFTLIELLVVIAIIAILAAILFPVFAQAKTAAKKTQTISNTKQMGTAMQIYLGDYDDTYPLANMYLFASNVPQNFLAWPYPAGWIQGWDGGNAEVANANNSYWSESVQPYTKNYQLSEAAGQPNQLLFATDGTATRAKNPANMGLVFNGLMQSYNATAIDNPSLVPILWTGRGRVNFVGRGTTNPVMQCTANTARSCVFSPSSPASPGAVNSTWLWTAGDGTKADLYGGGIIMTNSDTSTKYQRLSLNDVSGPVNTNIYEPWSTYRAGGRPNGIRLCTLDQSNIGNWHPCRFRPDFDGTRTKWQAIIE